MALFIQLLCECNTYECGTVWSLCQVSKSDIDMEMISMGNVDKMANWYLLVQILHCWGMEQLSLLLEHG